MAHIQVKNLGVCQAESITAVCAATAGKPGRPHGPVTVSVGAGIEWRCVRALAHATESVCAAVSERHSGNAAQRSWCPAAPAPTVGMVGPQHDRQHGISHTLCNILTRGHVHP